jgi:hypothetical protein
MVGPVHTASGGSLLTARNDHTELEFDHDTGALSIAGAMTIRCAPAARGLIAERQETTVAVSDPVLVRVIERGLLAEHVAYRVTYELFQTSNIHIYVRIEALAAIELDELELPRLAFERHALTSLADGDRRPGERFVDLEGDDLSLGVVVKKLPWRAHWNDVGAHGHRVIGRSHLSARSDPASLALRVPGRLTLDAGETVEAGIFLRPHRGDHAAVEAEATHEHPDEVRYVPEGEYRHTLLWETEEVWLGPPIFDGCPQRPHDQLIPRPLGLDVLARKRFTWNNEDFSLWKLTGKDRYWESGVKKAYALLATQNSHGGWFEGIEFYNLPRWHHHMYDTYIAGLFLLEAYDLTGFDGFLQAADRAKRFWTAEPPPANGHTEEQGGEWWYRWGGYVNQLGYTDERHVLNTHAGATAFLAQYYERTGDDEARRGLENGIAAVRWGLERGIQKGSGQFLYSLSQVDPTLERPGDPPYVQLDLVPQIEDVYTVATSYRLLVANRIARDPIVTAAIRRALDYWWTGYKAGTVYTYRAYAVIAYAVAAGELDLTYALALPALLKDPDHFTSLQRGHSSFVAPAGLPGLAVEVATPFVEPIFLRRSQREYLFALVNLEYPQSDLPVAVEIPTGLRAARVVQVDPASKDERALEFAQDGVVASFLAPAIGEFGVTAIRVELEG